MSFVCDNTLVNLTGTFGPRKRILLSNGQWSGGYHYGMDFAPEVRGTPLPVHAYKDGIVTSVGTRSDAGRYVIVYVPSKGVWIRYCHLSAYSVVRGQQLQEAQYIGRMGATGNVTGVHLHFEVYVDAGLSKRVNPYNYIWFEKNPMSFAINGAKPATPAPAPKPTPAPKPATPTTSEWKYTVQAGDSVSSIAKRLGMPWTELASYNGIKAPHTIHRGQLLRVPPKYQPKRSTGPKLVRGAKIRLAGNWVRYTVSTLAEKFDTPMPGGVYTVVDLRNGNIRLRGNGYDGWVVGSKAKAGLL